MLAGFLCGVLKLVCPWVRVCGRHGAFEAESGIQCGLIARCIWCFWVFGGTRFLEVPGRNVLCYCIVVTVGGWTSRRGLYRTCFLVAGRCRKALCVRGEGWPVCPLSVVTSTFFKRFGQCSRKFVSPFSSGVVLGLGPNVFVFRGVW